MDLVIIRARDLQRLHGTKHAAHYLRTLGLPVEAAVTILARGAA